MRIRLLDHGYIELVETWGSDERIIEAARMSTDKGFAGWGPLPCPDCFSSEFPGTVERQMLGGRVGASEMVQCEKCKGTTQVAGDERLLAYLWKNAHATPFEMAGMIVEVQAPIFVIREWHRHRTQGYNELSARYTPMPNVNYLPTRQRIIDGARATKNAQAAGVTPLAVEAIDDWLKALDAAYAGVQLTYETGLAIGIPKELARLPVPVGRYSRMRATANLRNWLGFLALRMDPKAQWEIREYANALGEFVARTFPRTWTLFDEGRKK